MMANKAATSKDKSPAKKGSTKTTRASETRANTAERKPWAPPSTLDAPPAPDGYHHRWVRVEAQGKDDLKNASARMREGYEPVRKSDHPEFEAPVVEEGRYEGVFGVGGLVLMRIPQETVAERTAYFKEKTSGQMKAIDNDMLKENAHDTMRITKANRKSRVTFGGGSQA